MGTNFAGLQPGQFDHEGLSQAFATLSLRCVECAALYPAQEAQPRYRCDCGGVLDVEARFQHPWSQEMSLQVGYDALASADDDLMPLAGASWRQLFDERAARPPIWPIGDGSLLLDYSGVWRYRELILPLPPSMIVSRPEGNTSLYAVGLENCGDGRDGHRRIGQFAGVERLFLKHEGENPTGSFKQAPTSRSKRD